jgi:hypothetical protein
MITPLMIPSSIERAISRVITKETEHFIKSDELNKES